jgi:hypothetical protein
VKEGKVGSIKELDEILSEFTLEKLKSIPSADMLVKAKGLLNMY